MRQITQRYPAEIVPGLTRDIGLLVNSSRGIIYASSEHDFSERAGEAAMTIQQEMEAILKANSIL